MASCVICDVIEPKATGEKALITVIGFIKILDNLTRNKSFDKMAREALFHYNINCLKNNNYYIKMGMDPLPIISKEIILNHLQNHNKSQKQALFSIMNHTSNQAIYYQNKINRVQQTLDNLVQYNEDGDVVMGESEEGDEDNLEKYKEEVNRLQRLFEKNVHTLLNVNKAITSL